MKISFYPTLVRFEKKALIFAAHSISPYREMTMETGFLAERLGTALQKLLQRFESARNLPNNIKPS